MSLIDIVVPCYNEEAGLRHFVEVTNSVIEGIPEHKLDIYLSMTVARTRLTLL